MNAIDGVGDRRRARREVKAASVLGRLCAVMQKEMQVRQALVLLLLDRVAHQLPPEKIVRLEVFALEHQLLNLG